MDVPDNTGFCLRVSPRQSQKSSRSAAGDRNRKLTSAEHEELKGWLAEIRARREALREEHPDWKNLEAFAEAAGHSVSTWHAWRRDTDPTSPKFFDLRDFARLVGCDVRWVSYDVAQAARNGLDEIGGLGAGDNVTSEMRQVLTAMEGLPADLQQDILDMAERHRRRWERISANPEERDEGAGQPRNPRKASAGPTAK